MGDFAGLDAKDLLGLAEPLTKLEEIIAHGIGKLYEPIHVRRMAKAKADEISIISHAINENINLPVSYQDSAVCISAAEANDLVQRAQNRFLFQQIKKQQNIESVIDIARAELKNKPAISNTPVSEDWINSFFDFVENVSSEQMQEIWGKLLAGEVEHPGSFSIRTLDVLRKMSQREAQYFMDVFPFILICPGNSQKTYYDYFLPSLSRADSDLISQPYYTYQTVFDLDDVGLISSNVMASIGLEIFPNSTEKIQALNSDVEIKNISDKIIAATHPAYLLTTAGKELYNVLYTSRNGEKVDETYLQEFVDSLNEYHLDQSGRIVRLEFTVHHNKK